MTIICYFAVMKVSGILVFLLFFVTVSCYRPQRACKDFKDGQFSFSTTINGEKKTTRFTRFGNTEIDFFEGKSDTSTIRWINDCEYIVKKTNPSSRSEEKSIHMKILTTTDSSYTFEYGIVGSSKKSRGTVIKVN